MNKVRAEGAIGFVVALIVAALAILLIVLDHGLTPHLVFGMIAALAIARLT